MAQSKALRSRQIGTEGQIIARMFSEYDANARPPVRGCYTSSPLVSSSHNFSSSLSFNSSRLVNNLGFILCISDEADHSAIAVIVSLYINKIQWQTNTAVINFTFWFYRVRLRAKRLDQLVETFSAPSHPKRLDLRLEFASTSFELVGVLTRKPWILHF